MVIVETAVNDPFIETAAQRFDQSRAQEDIIPWHTELLVGGIPFSVLGNTSFTFSSCFMKETFRAARSGLVDKTIEIILRFFFCYFVILVYPRLDLGA